jgi:hypothetical protein
MNFGSVHEAPCFAIASRITAIEVSLSAFANAFSAAFFASFLGYAFQKRSKSMAESFEGGDERGRVKEGVIGETIERGREGEETVTLSRVTRLRAL